MTTFFRRLLDSLYFLRRSRHDADPASLALLTDGSWSYPVYQQINARATGAAGLFDGALAWSPQDFDLSQGGQTALVDGAYVSGNFFELLGVPAARGRMLTPSDDAIAAPDGPVAIISHRFWRQHFAGAATSSDAGSRCGACRSPSLA